MFTYASNEKFAALSCGSLAQQCVQLCAQIAVPSLGQQKLMATALQAARFAIPALNISAETESACAELK